ncbi:carbohydrate-binding protein [Actinokineospora cianjurensis]|uniref:Protocatechuate 3,4-dioxygenase beta subunit n=1 Tax=Actinokineospora cianjurensis TaxID=585224 RepID=A0A421B8V7_9PSEU|nr:carbohydrate-binding protein [Actinokineospora cianjurensis]RLK60966.1 protocatechuate 3,4-dioxygenase beta subunit [Actinokineospora cianjurensis]
MDAPLHGEGTNEQPPADGRQISRKAVLRAALAAGVAAPIALVGVPALARTRAEEAANGALLELTPDCNDGDAPTIEQTEGPYFKPGSPRRTSLVEPGYPGTALTVSGYVFGRQCQPLANVLLDFWQADNGGNYDNTTYRFRGHQYTDANGRYSLTTIVPGLYPGRTRHIHMKVQNAGGRILTTQTYFPGEPRNNTDTIYDPRLLMAVRTVGSGKEATFDFVLNVNGVPPTTTTRPTSSTTTTTTTRPTNPTTTTTTGSPGGTWAAGTNYATGAKVTYGGSSYTCLQGHQAQPGWEPPNVPALWRVG